MLTSLTRTLGQPGQNCRESGTGQKCSVNLGKIASRAVFSPDKANTDLPRCDCIVWDPATGRVILVELKRGQVDASKVRDQLQGGLDELSRAVAAQKPINAPRGVNLYLAHQKSIHIYQLNQLKRMVLSWHKFSGLRIHIVRCGMPIA